MANPILKLDRATEEVNLTSSSSSSLVLSGRDVFYIRFKGECVQFPGPLIANEFQRERYQGPIPGSYTTLLSPEHLFYMARPPSDSPLMTYDVQTLFLAPCLSFLGMEIDHVCLQGSTTPYVTRFFGS